MPIYLGGAAASKIYVGNTPAKRVYHGDKLVWPVTLTVEANAVSGSEAENEQRFWQRQAITTGAAATDYEIPAWVEWVDELVLGAGAGASGSVLTSPGKGGKGGTWAVRESPINTLLSAAGINGDPSRMYATVTVGVGGAGGAYDALTYRAGQNGGFSRTQLFAVDGGVTKTLNAALTGAGGVAAAGGGLADLSARPGGPAQGGNLNSGRDYRTANDPGFIYVGGSGVGSTSTGGPGNPPGGGAAGGGAGNINQPASLRGADGSVWLRFDSRVAGVLNQQQFITPGSGELDLLSPAIKTSLVQVAVVGAGAGGGGGGQFLNGAGGQAGRWATYAAPWNIESLLPSGVTLSSLTRLWIEWTVGTGGAGGVNGNPGGKGGASTATLKCQTATNTYTLGATRTGIGGNPLSGSGSAGEQNGLGVVGGNANAGRDMSFAVNGKTFAFKGGDPLPEFGAVTILNRPLRVGNAPGGGGDGGTAGGLGGSILNGMRGGHGAVHVVYVYTLNFRNGMGTEQEVEGE